MEGAVAGVLYGVETLAEGALALAKGIYNPTAPLKATFKRIKGPSIPRSSHSLSVVKGRAYIFGGEIAPRQPVDNSMHVVVLPSTDLTDADYTEVPAKSASAGGEVPPARVGHSAATVGDCIYIFGGRGGPSMSALEEKGRVWAFDTVSNTWSYLDPAPSSPYPESRSYHTSTSTPHPYPPSRDLKRNPLDEPPKRSSNIAEPSAANTHGTIFIHAGCLSSGGRTSDLWERDFSSFDIASRSWAQLPSAPDPGRGGTSLVMVGSSLYRFGGFDGTRELGGEIDYLDMRQHNTFDDPNSTTSAQIPASPAPAGPWRTAVFPVSSTKDDEDSGVNKRGPSNRSVAGLVPVTMGQGRHYLLLLSGETSPSTHGHAGAGKFLDDVWSYQIKPEGMTAASVKDATRGVLLGKETGEGVFVECKYHDADGVMVQEGQQKPMLARGWLASDAGGDLGGLGSAIVWGGVGEDNERLGDGWIVTVE